jgi:hypothetical protein
MQLIQTDHFVVKDLVDHADVTVPFAMTARNLQ